jgi:glycosyltransferase involved in cell wall biosynthesis
VNKEMQNPSSILDELNRFTPDIVHVHYLGHQRDEWGRQDWKWYDNAFKALEAYNCPVIENINIPTEPYISKRVTHYVYVSSYVEKEFGRPGHWNEVIYPGTDFTRFTRQNLADIPDNCIGMVYRLERDKINEESIRVFTEVVKRRKETRVLIVGGGTLLDHFRKAVEDAGLTENFIFTGYVSYDDLPQYYKMMSIFIAPVHKESFGQVSPMAMNMGIPVAGYHTGALPEIIADESLLAPPGDYKKLAEIVIDLLDDRERRLKTGAANHSRAVENFSVEAMIRSYQEIYTSLTMSNP